MELVLKLPQNKPPFVGIVYPDFHKALTDSEYLLNIPEGSSVSLKVKLDDSRDPQIILYIDYREFRYLKVWTDEYYAVKNYRKFENSEVVKFGPVVKNADGSHSPVWSVRCQKWISVNLGAIGFYFRNHL